jgi:pimeloyl-ACP methyl ester carboxylesterase
MQAVKWPSFLFSGLCLVALPALASEAAATLKACRLPAVEHDALCGSLKRPLDPAAPGGVQIEIHFAVLPAVARNKKPDPLFFFAGGPGQSAIDLAGSLAPMLARFSNRRDIVLIDQRGTGRSAPLVCDDVRATRPLREAVDLGIQRQQLKSCRERLMALPHGDLRRYTTSVAVQDANAVRRHLGAEQINLVGGSYGTRVVLEYMRQFPQTVRRAVIDGVAPPDMVLPMSLAVDQQAAFDALLQSCAMDAACRVRYPSLRQRWDALLVGLPREVSVLHPVTGVPETLTLTREVLGTLVRGPLYSPTLASALPMALTEASEGRYTALFGLAASLGSRRATGLAAGMHYSVVCAEDVPRMAGQMEPASPDFGDGFAALYRDVCADWPRAEVPAAFYTLAPAPAATLVLSGGIDPATPPRHGLRVARALGAKAHHVVVANAGHGVMALGCMRDVLFRFVDATSDEEAFRVDTGCAADVPRPPAFLPVDAAPVP